MKSDTNIQVNQRICFSFSKLFYCLIFIAIILHPSQCISTNPIFVTTLLNIESGLWVLSTTSPTTASGFSYQNTQVTFLNLYTSTPNIGYGIGFMNSNYQTTLSLVEMMVDVSIVQKVQSYALIQLNRTANSITQLAVNYVVCDSSFWLDVRQTLVDLSSTVAYTSASSLQRSVIVQIPYKTKSNSSNAQVVYNTVGLDMFRQSRTFQYQLSLSAKSLSSFNLSILVGGYNRLKWIRINSFSYEAIANTVDPPYFIDMGIVVSFAGIIPDSSGLTISSFGTVFTGMTDWTIDDTNSVLNYNMTLTALNYLLTTASLTQTKTSFFWYRKQTCPDYTFLSNNVCQPCHHSCLTCASIAQTACMTCPTTRTYVSTNHTCPCITNYVDVNVSMCVQLTCQATCLTCANLNQCGTCESTLGRLLNGTDCICKNYTLDVYDSMSTVLCYPCHYTCLSCSAAFAQTSCLSCNLVKDHRLFKASNNTCACIDKYYAPTSTSNPVCLSCHYSCATCLNSLACTQCNSTKGRFLNSSSSLCSCANSYYDDLLSQQCVSCDSQCLTCNALGCLSCSTVLYRVLSSRQCICMNGYFDDGVNGLCQTCNFTCATCSSSLQCSSCNSSLQRYMDISTGSNVCLCAQRYFSVQGVQQCMFCFSNCKSCNGSNQNNCLSCDSTKYRELSIQSKCVCITGYYEVLGQLMCQRCNYTCKTCSDSLSCSTCDAVKFRVTSVGGYCSCMNGYYDNGNELCIKCDYKCLTCSSSLTCLTCDSLTRNTTNLANCSCLQGFWDDGVNSFCQTCLPECLTCLDANGCTGCPANRVLTVSRNCICKSRTYQPSCLNCQYSCQQCTNTAVQCTRCNGTALRYLNLTSSTCVCYNGYFDDGVNQNCQSCHYSCSTCASYSTCLTCPLNRIMNGSLCACANQFYQNNLNKNCLSCHYSCKSCSSFSECTSCDTLSFRTFPSTPPINLTLCQCMNGYYDNGLTELCYACDHKCLTCSAFGTCLTCNSTLKRYFSPLTFDCLCLDGFYEDTTTFLCTPCHYSCKTCINSLACLTCPTGRYQPTGINQYCLCNNGTFDNPLTHACQLCSYPCLQCSTQPSSCIQCDTSRNLIAVTSKCQCKTGTFQNGTACDSCLSTCSQCTNKTACTVCKLGSNRNLDANNLCPCIYGYHDSDSTLSTCLKCHYSCLTCSNALTCNTCYSGRIPVSGSTCICPVQRYFDDGTNGACIPCAYSCLACNGLPDNCTSCSPQSNRQLINNQCSCKLGYFNNNVQVCIPCHYSCKSCSSSSACLTCDISLMRVYSTGPYCNCAVGFYDDGITQQCQQCDYTCNECTATSTQCSSCPLTRTYDIINHKCPCTQGLYDSATPTCSSCLYSCKTCINSIECTSCPTTRYLETTTKQCLCNNGLYNVNLQLQCLSCHPLCLTCNDYNNCLTCDTTSNFRYLLSGDCVCPNGYFDNFTLSNNLDGICRRCHYSCQNCVSPTQCSSCSSLGGRIYNISSRLCACQSGLYDDGLNMPCLKCPFDCLTCVDSNTCLTCPTERSLNVTTNRCQCSQSYYVNGTQCQLCAPQCSSCSDLTTCTGCNGQRMLFNSSCICAVEFYILPNTALCANCQYTCLSCVSSLACSTCDISNHRYLAGSYCKCMTGFYDDNASQPCLPCQYSCKTCLQSNKCLSCDLTLNRAFNLNTFLCDCLDGYYQDPNTKLCIKCHYTCLTCTTGNTCMSCNPLYFRLLNLTNSKCQCPLTGYFDDSSQQMCQTCDFKCLSCQTLSTTCTTCLNTTNRALSVDKCICKGGYFQIGVQSCPRCSYKCLTCMQVADNCTSCSSAAMRTVSPLCACEIGFYDDGSSTLCKICDYRCQSCSNAFTCLTCDSAMKRIMNPLSQICNCISTFYDNGSSTQCIPCGYSCVTCNDPTLCLTCPLSRVYQNGICACKSKYYDDFSSLQCVACDYTCKTCTNATQCSSCSIFNNRVFNTSSLRCSCMQGFYDSGISQQLCLKCESSCLTCVNNLSCQSCPSNVNKTLNLTISNYCKCFYGYYENITAGLLIGESSVCFACHYSCQQCTGNAYSCTQCETVKHRYLTAEKQCLCGVGYFDDGLNELCLQCTHNCLACWGPGVNQCLSCDNSTYILNNQCYSQCPQYYMNSITPTYTKTCKLCTPFCLQCSPSSTTCLTCQSTHRLIKYNTTHTLCIDHCPQLYYESSTKECLQCQPPCYHCTGKYNCTDCISGYYLDQYCYKCHPYCYSCHGPTAFDCITCANDYFLDNGLCRKLTCGLYQYVHSLKGCVDCSVTYPNSLTCDSQLIKSCKDNYMLQSTTVNNGSSITVCKTCSDTPGYKISSLSNGVMQCIQECGDGIIINDQCDDGNTLNGDGCSEYCTIQKEWSCIDKRSCSLRSQPSISVSKVSKIQKTNEIQIWLQLTIGLRLVRQNFLLIFDNSNVQFNYSLQGINNIYTKYKLVVSYQSSIQNSKLSIKVASPIVKNAQSISRTLVQKPFNQILKSQRSLQQIQLSIPLQIQLSLQLQVQILTQPPANFINPQTRTTFTSYLIYIFIAYQLICISLAIWMLYKKIMFLLIIVDLFTSLRIIYLLCTFGMHNVTDLLPSAAKGLQPFIYPFGPYLQDTSSAFYQFGYTQLIFSSSIIQLVLIIVCIVIKYMSSKGRQNTGHYYLNALLFSCSTDIYLSCLNIFKQTQFSGFVGSYSWTVSIIILIAFIMHTFMYIMEGKSINHKNRKILPTKSFVTSEMQAKEKDFNNNILEMSEFGSRVQEKPKLQQGQMWSENNTEIKLQDKSCQIHKGLQKNHAHDGFFSNNQNDYNLWDLAPNVNNKSKQLYETESAFYETTSRNKISPYHLPVLNNLLPLALVLISTLLDSKDVLSTRSCLLFAIISMSLIFLLCQRQQTIKSSVRNIKLIFNYLAYMVICGILSIATLTHSQNHNQWIDYSVLCIIMFMLLLNVLFWLINLKYSPQYKEYLIQIKNQEIIRKNKIQQQPRKKFYTLKHQTTIPKITQTKNIFNTFSNQYQHSQELRSNSVSEINSISEEKSYYNQKPNNVFQSNSQDPENLSPNQKIPSNQSIQINDHYQTDNNRQIQDLQSFKVRSINQYIVDLNQSKSFAGQKCKSNEKIITSNLRKTQISDKTNHSNAISKTKERIKGQQFPDKQKNSQENNRFQQKKQKTNKSVEVLDNSAYIQKNKRISSKKISQLSKLQNIEDYLNQKSLLNTQPTVVHDQKDKKQNVKLNKRIELNVGEKLLYLESYMDQIEQKPKVQHKHYMYKNQSKSVMDRSKEKSKSKGLNSSGSLQIKGLNIKQSLKSNSKTLNFQDKVLRLEPSQNNTIISDYEGRQTDGANQQGKKQIIIAMHTNQQKIQQTKQNYKSKDLLQLQYRREKIKNSFDRQRQEVNEENKMRGEEMHEKLSDELSEEDYELEFPTGINSSIKEFIIKQNSQPSRLKSQSNKLRRLKKSPSKISSKQKSLSYSPSKLSNYPRQRLEDISSIHEQQYDVYPQNQKIEIQQDLNVYNKILKDHQKYKNKKVDPKLLEKELQNKKD